MAYLTEGQKSGLEYLLKDYPIQKAGLINYDMLKPMRTYQVDPAVEDEFADLDLSDAQNWGLYGLTEHPSIAEKVPPKGPPSGLYKERGADPFAYISNLEEFGMATGPKPDEQGRLNARIANAAAHEIRHQYFADNPELLEDLDITALGNDSYIAEETYNRFLDSLAQGKSPSIHDLYENPALIRYMKMHRPGQGPFGQKGIEDLFLKAAQKYKKHITPKAGPPARRPSQQEGGGGAPHIARSRDRGGLGISQSQAQSVREANKAAGMSGWRLAHGGMVDKSLSGRSRDI